MDATDVAVVQAKILKRSVRSNSGCLLWDRPSKDGYGELRHQHKLRGAHVWSYLAWKGTIPADHHIDHLCNVRLCVEPGHLEAVLQAENNRRMTERGRNHMSLKSCCPAGHPYSIENTKYVKNASGGRSRKCRTCRRSATPQHFPRGTNNARAKLNDEIVRYIRELADSGLSGRKIAANVSVEMGRQISSSAVFSVISRRTWAHVG